MGDAQVLIGAWSRGCTCRGTPFGSLLVPAGAGLGRVVMASCGHWATRGQKSLWQLPRVYKHMCACVYALVCVCRGHWYMSHVGRRLRAAVGVSTVVIFYTSWSNDFL